jgi:hypothetical protein
LFPRSEELFLIRTEDIGYFEPMLLSFRWNGVRRADEIERAQHSSGLLVERMALSERSR